MTLGLNLLLPEEIINVIAENYYEINAGADWILYEDESMLLETLHEFYTSKELDHIIGNIQKTGEFSMQKDMKNNLMLTDLKMVWDENTQTYRNLGGKAGLVYFGNKSMNTQTRIYLELGMRRSSDYFSIYLETDFDDWYLFTYRQNVLKILSSVPEFNESIMLMNPDKRTFKGEKGQSLVFMLGTLSQRNNFVSRMKYLDPTIED